MPTIAANSTILLTGATGYIGAHLLKILLARGHTVRITSRSQSKAQATLADNDLASAHQAGKLEFSTVPDMTQPGAFDSAVKGVHAICHLASPVGVHFTHPDDLIKPAQNGVTTLFTSARDHAGPQLQRIVFTSSCAAVASITHETQHVSEASWCTEFVDMVTQHGDKAPLLAWYRTSKILAERAAWDFMAQNKDLTWDLTTLCPPWVFGPPAHQISDEEFFKDPESGSWKTLGGVLLKGTFPAATSNPGTTLLDAPLLGHGWVDVRDISEAHARALETQSAGGERVLIVSGGFVWNDWLVAGREMGGVLDGLRLAEPMEGEATNNLVWNLEKEKKIFGIRFRTKKETLNDQLALYASRGWHL